MKVIFTASALQDLDEIRNYLKSNYPTIAGLVEKRFRTTITRISAWPESAEAVPERPGVRVAPLVRYPYKVFYRIMDQSVEILHIHHASRRQPWDDEHAPSDDDET